MKKSELKAIIAEISESLKNSVCPVCKRPIFWEKSETDCFPIPFGLAAEYTHKLRCKACRIVFIEHKDQCRIR